jgi:hypothetical protein
MGLSSSSSVSFSGIVGSGLEISVLSQREEIENAQIQESGPDIGLFAWRMSSQEAQDMRGGVPITKASLRSRA